MRLINGVLLCLSLLTAQARAEWYPLAVRADGELVQYSPLAQASRPWRICALLPHGKDRYWWGVAWGLDGEARRQGVQLGIYEAGGYENSAQQVAQLHNCRGEHADAYVIASISTAELCPEVARLLQDGKPVIDLVNGLECPGLTAHSRVDFADMASAALAYIDQLKPPAGYRLGWLPGPQGAGWVAAAEAGLQRAMQGHAVELVHGGYGPVDRASQAQLVRDLLAGPGRIDFILGNAEAVAFAAQLVLQSGRQADIRVLSLYATERVLEQIAEDRILAAPSDSPVLQARIAVDLAVRALEGQPHPREVGPLIEVLDRAALQHFDLSRLMPPEGHWMIRRDLPQ